MLVAFSNRSAIHRSFPPVVWYPTAVHCTALHSTAQQCNDTANIGYILIHLTLQSPQSSPLPFLPFPPLFPTYNTIKSSIIFAPIFLLFIGESSTFERLYASPLQMPRPAITHSHTQRERRTHTHTDTGRGRERKRERVLRNRIEWRRLKCSRPTERRNNEWNNGWMYFRLLEQLQIYEVEVQKHD